MSEVTALSIIDLKAIVKRNLKQTISFMDFSGAFEGIKQGNMSAPNHSTLKVLNPSKKFS